MLLMALIFAIAGVTAVGITQYASSRRKADDNESKDTQMESFAEIAKQVTELSKEAINSSTSLTRLAIEGNKPLRDLGWVDGAAEPNGHSVQPRAQHASS
jgi:hypothetical protein